MHLFSGVGCLYEYAAISYRLQAMVSASWASPQSTTCIGTNFVACTHASFSRCTCSHSNSSLASASPHSAAPTMAPSIRDQTISQLWQMGTQLSHPIVHLLLILQSEVKGGQCTYPPMPCGIKVGSCKDVCQQIVAGPHHNRHVSQVIFKMLSDTPFQHEEFKFRTMVILFSWC